MSLVCIVTGSTQGIGLAIAKHLYQQGHRVVINGYHEIPQAIKDDFGPDSLFLSGDVSDYQVCQELLAQVKEVYGRVDVLVNNAGITRDGLMMRMSEEDFDQVIATNLKGAFNMCRHTVPLMLKQRSGRIINMSSIVALTGNAGQVNYAASKAGLLGLTKSLAQEVASRSITVNAVAPGFIRTEMTEVLSDKVKAKMLERIPLKRLGEVEEVVGVVDFLIQQPYITGQTIEVNGGMHM